MNTQQKTAQAWFNTLETIDFDDAMAILADGEEITTMHGSVPDSMTRQKAVDLIKQDVRLAPTGQGLHMSSHRLIVMDTDGFPAQLQTRLDPIFLAIMPTGWWWTDRTREVDGDYAKLAFLSFATLQLEVYPDCPSEYYDRISAQARKFIAMEGQDYQISGSGQTIRLGFGKDHATR